MIQPSFDWKLERGFTDLIDGLAISLKLKHEEVQGELRGSLASLALRREPLDLAFSAGETLRGKGPAGFRWVIDPEQGITARLLPPGCAFLGNFRVPADRIGVQWTVSAVVQGSIGRTTPMVAEFTSGTRLSFVWVSLFEREAAVPEALGRAWASFRDPFRSRHSASIEDSQTIQVTWTGRCRFRFSLGWETAFASQASAGLLLARATGTLGAGLEGTVELETARSGDFVLRLYRRGARVTFSLRRTSSGSGAVGLTAGIEGYSRVRVKLQPGLLDPAMAPLRKPLEAAVNRRFGLAVSAEWARTRSSRTVLQARWDGRSSEEIEVALALLIDGKRPAPAPGFSCSSVLESLFERRSRLLVQFLKLPLFGEEKSVKGKNSLEVDPVGNLLITEGLEISRTRYAWDHRQFLRLCLERSGGGPLATAPYLWSLGWEGPGDGPLDDWLRIPLRCRAMERFSLPGGRKSSLRTSLVWITEFEAAGLERVRAATPEEHLAALIWALQNAHPAAYRAGSHRRDWIESESLREVVRTQPVQAHLSSYYPISGRSQSQRLQVVSEYRRVTGYLDWISQWAAGIPLTASGFLAKGLNLPLFVAFHRLCPLELRRSVVVGTGSLELLEGDESLWDEVGAGYAQN